MSIFLSVLSDVAGILGLALSVYSLVRDYLRSRPRFTIDVIDYANRGRTAQFYFRIANRSNRPLIITGILYRETLCELDPKRIRVQRPPLPTHCTPQFPLAIEAQEAGLYYIEFVNPPQKQLSRGIPVTFQIQTISQTVLKTVPLGEQSHYLHIGR